MKIFSPTISGSSQASGSLTISGSLNVSQGITGSLLGTASWAINVVNGGGGGSTDTGSLLKTASVNLNTITFTKGDGSTFPITVNTGSGGGGSVGTLAQVTALGASTTVPITASIISASQSITADSLTVNNFSVVDTLGIGDQIFYAHGEDGFSVNENFNAGGTTQTAYHFTSGDANRTSVVFSLARTSNFTNMFGVTGSAANNKFVFGAEYGNTDFEWRAGLGIAPVQLQGGSLLASLSRIGNLFITGSITGSSIISTGGFTGSLFGTSSWAQSASNAVNSQTASFLPVGTYSVTSSWATNSISSSLASRNLLTASVSSNTITFTKGDGSTFPITVNTGSGGGGSIGTLQQVTEQGASTTVPITSSIVSASSFTGSLFGTASWALNVVGGGGGGGVTINNNVDNYLITATGTANTLNGESGLTFDGTTLTVAGNAVINAVDVRNDPSTTIGQYAQGAHMGRDWPAAGGPALTAGNIVYFSGSSQWTNAIASTTGSSTNVLGVVTDNEDPNEIVLQGTVTVNTNLAGYTVGTPVYLSPSSAGKVTNVPPSTTGHVARYIGWVTDPNRGQIYFNPDFTWIEL